MIYEICNPSDAYTMESDDEMAAVLACLLLGDGHYPAHIGIAIGALKEVESGRQVCPFFLGGVEQWFRDTYRYDLAGGMNAKAAAIADALDSVLIGTASDRAEVAETLKLMPAEKHTEFLAMRHDKRRSSMNDIGAHAKRMAAGLRKRIVTKQGG